MNASPAESEPKRSRAAVRYTYASGSRPLEGYTIKRGVGSGGFGEVYFALSDAGKEVALKLIRRNLDVELRGVTQCLNLKHQNLVALYDIRDDEQDDRWVVMEYVSGESLEDAIDRHPEGMPLEEAMHWFTGIAAGVAYLHDHGIVHRDLKPANIFLDESIVKIGDYGLSKFISCSRRSGQTESVGTVHYMAPEIANGRYGREIDTYALGIILYEMLTGHVPFEGESVGEVLMKHLTAEPELDALDEPFRSIVRGAMAKDPDQRIKSVAEMLDQLPATARPISLNPSATPTANGQQHGDGLSEDAAGNARNTSQSNEEPILAGLRAGWKHLKSEYRDSQLHPLLKAFVGILMILALVATSPEWLPMFMLLGFSYMVYRGVRAVVAQPGQAKRQAKVEASKHVVGNPTQVAHISPARKNLTPVPQTRRQKKLTRNTRQQRINRFLAEKSWRDRVTELTGSMLVAAVVASIATLVVCMITQAPLQLELYVWMALVTTFASWAIMVPAKFAEGRVEDQAPMRFILLVAGSLVGVVAWGLADVLMLRLPASKGIGIKPNASFMSEIFGWYRGDELSTAFSQGLVHPPMAAYAAYFAFLFVILAWWRSADASRVSRVSVWRVFWCGFIAYVLQFFWWFPQPVGLFTAAIVAFTIQLSSNWLPPSRRRAIVEQGGEI